MTKMVALDKKDRHDLCEVYFSLMEEEGELESALFTVTGDKISSGGVLVSITNIIDNDAGGKSINMKMDLVKE